MIITSDDKEAIQGLICDLGSQFHARKYISIQTLRLIPTLDFQTGFILPFLLNLGLLIWTSEKYLYIDSYFLTDILDLGYLRLIFMGLSLHLRFFLSYFHGVFRWVYSVPYLFIRPCIFCMCINLNFD